MFVCMVSDTKQYYHKRTRSQLSRQTSLVTLQGLDVFKASYVKRKRSSINRKILEKRFDNQSKRKLSVK